MGGESLVEGMGGESLVEGMGGESLVEGTVGELLVKDDVDFISASLENSLGSFGGFGCGKSYVIDHQRLSGLGYCFSASTPPMLSQAAILALDLLKNSPEMVDRLHGNSAYLLDKLSKVPGLRVVGDIVSPVLHLQLADSCGNRAADLATLRCIVQMAEEEGVALVVASYLEKDERQLPPPSIRLSVNCDLGEQEMDRVVDVIDNACLASQGRASPN
ncbi:Serine palmitoyltransferase 1 [Lamellibrachia satsuma]|nr:Serine palmitoyltransferase 1 [Lamellibrachia satsuma]